MTASPLREEMDAIRSAQSYHTLAHESFLGEEKGI